MGFSSAASLRRPPRTCRSGGPAPRFPAAGLSSCRIPSDSPSPRRDPSSSRGLAALSPSGPPPHVAGSPLPPLPAAPLPDRCTWGSRSCTPAAAPPFCRRSSGPPRRAPAPSPRAGPPGRTRVGFGLGGARRAASASAPQPTPRAPQPGLGPAPTSVQPAPRPSTGGGPGPAPAPPRD